MSGYVLEELAREAVARARADAARSRAVSVSSRGRSRWARLGVIVTRTWSSKGPARRPEATIAASPDRVD